MPTPTTISITPGTGLLLDAVTLVVGSNSVIREIMVIADPTNPTSLAGVTTAGAIQVDGSATTQPVSGTIVANQGGAPWSVTFPSAQPVTLASTAITGSVAVTGTFWQATQPVSISGNLTVIQPTAALLNATVVFGSPQHVIVDSASFTVSENLAQVNGVALGSPSAYGTPPGAINVIGVNAFITNTPAVTLASTSITGTVAVTQSTSPWVVADAAAEASLTTIATNVGILPTAIVFIQAVASSAGTGISTLDKVFGSPVTKGNVLLLMSMESAGAIPTWAKSAGTATVQSLQVIKSSAAAAPGFSLHAWLVLTTGTLTMTTTSAASASVDMAAYAVEIQGVFPAGVGTTSIPWWDAIQVSQGTAASFSFTPFYTETIGELPFMFIGVASAATITTENLGDPIMPAARSDATTGGAGNLQLFSTSRPTNGAPFLKMGNLSPSITFSGSTQYTAVYITLRPYQLSIAGSVTANLNRVGGNAVVTAASGIQLIGNADGVGNPLTSNSTTPTAKFALDSNITSILGTAPTTVGKLDVKGADGDVFVRQTTAANLNATVVGTGTFAVQATLAAETTKVIGTVNQGTSPWVVTDTAAAATLVQIQQELRQQSAFPNLVQVAPFQSSASATSLTLTFSGSGTVGNQLMVVGMSSTTTLPTFSVTGGTGTAVLQAIVKTSTTAPSFSVAMFRVLTAGTIIITVTYASGACAAIGYEISGLPLSGSLPNSQPFYDVLLVSQGTASAATLSSFFTLLPGELPFMFVGLGAATTVSSSSPGTTRLPSFTLDGTNGLQNVAASGNLQTFFAGRISGGPLEDITQMAPAATFSGSSLFSCLYISFKPVSMPIGGTVGSILTQISGNAVVSAAAGVQQVGIVGGTGVSLETTAGVLDLNLKNVGNNPVVTGTGVSGVGIPRVTVSSDSIPSVAATGATAPTSAEEIGFVDPQGKLAAVSATAPLPIQTDPQMLQVVALLTRILACLESMKMQDGNAYGAYENTDDHYDQAN